MAIDAHSIRIWEGDATQQGATWDGLGVNFSLFSASATKVELCLFDSTGTQETQRIELPEFTDEVWHGYLPDVGSGDGLCLSCPWSYEPEAGHRFNANKLVLDPYAKAHVGRTQMGSGVIRLYPRPAGMIVPSTSGIAPTDTQMRGDRSLVYLDA